LRLGSVVIWSCREDEMKNVHFDTHQYSHVFWKEPSDLRTALEARIRSDFGFTTKLYNRVLSPRQDRPQSALEIARDAMEALGRPFRRQQLDDMALFRTSLIVSELLVADDDWRIIRRPAP
jgi:hypothetical protein